MVNMLPQYDIFLGSLEPQCIGVPNFVNTQRLNRRKQKRVSTAAEFNFAKKGGVIEMREMKTSESDFKHCVTNLTLVFKVRIAVCQFYVICIT